MPESEVIVRPSVLFDLVETILISHGARPTEAAVQAHVWLEGDLRDQPSHGVQRLPTLVGRIQNGRLNCLAEPKWRWLTDAVLAVDGDEGFGPVVAFKSADRLLDRVRSTGVAVALIRNTNHLGMLAPYVELIAARGAVGMALSTSEALVHPWGGAQAMVGTNPIAIAIPAEKDCPLLLDMSTGATSAGRILQYARSGRALPDGWAVDALGRQTTDAQAAIDGAITPFGGPKGYALGLALGTMVAALTGTALGRSVRGTLDMDQPTTKGDLLIVFDPARLGNNRVAEHTTAYLAEVRNSVRVSANTPITIPGDRARAVRNRRLRDGIPVDRALWETLMSLTKTSEEAGD